MERVASGIAFGYFMGEGSDLAGPFVVGLLFLATSFWKLDYKPHKYGYIIKPTKPKLLVITKKDK